MTRSTTKKPDAISAPYGTWASEISSALIVSDSISIDETHLTKDSVYYIERRPHESGRCVIVKVTGNNTIDILPPPYSARSRVHEYGGGSFCISGDLVFFINDSDQDIYSLHNGNLTRITTAPDKRFADFSYDNKSSRIIAICESHTDNQTTNSIVSIDIINGDISTIEHGNDFYASPRLNKSATRLCWQTWNHPNMPWQGNQLWLADINNGAQLINKKHIAGADDISVFQPQWSPDEKLYLYQMIPGGGICIATLTQNLQSK